MADHLSEVANVRARMCSRVKPGDVGRVENGVRYVGQMGRRFDQS